LRRQVASLTFLFITYSNAQAQVSLCEQAGSDAERLYALPSGLLLAIGRVESGRWDATYRRTVPWPWAIDAAGEARLVENKEAAVSLTRSLQVGGLRNIDVGCFQINLQNHPVAFADLEQAFDPAANAQYAARFLTSLRTRLGGWEEAVAAYHSSTPARGVPYRQAVYSTCTGPGAITPASLPARNVEPLVVYKIDGVQINVWSPSRSGTAAGLIGITRPASTDNLPRVITPAR
jgi:hypothetical protein